CNISRSSILAILFAGVVSMAVVFPLKAVYAHTFSGGESAAFLALVKILQADSNLVQSNIASNATLAQAHANAVAEHLDANTTKELAERNKLVANDLTKAISDLNQTVQSKPTPAADIVKGKINNINALLQEAVTVRVEKNQLTNSTVKGQAVADIVDEALERYREAYGIEEGKSTAGHNTIVNIADYQSAQAIAAKAQEMFNEAKQITSTSSAAITKVGNDLTQFKNDIDMKTPYDKVNSYMEDTLDPDIKAAFKL
ncbi:MAG: hypothetical protein ACJ72R_13340, partial [Nitrososphaeraceae archaeon]